MTCNILRMLFLFFGGRQRRHPAFLPVSARKLWLHKAQDEVHIPKFWLGIVKASQVAERNEYEWVSYFHRVGILSGDSFPLRFRKPSGISRKHLMFKRNGR